MIHPAQDTYKLLDVRWQASGACLCVGLDPTLESVVQAIGRNDYQGFLQTVIDASAPYALAFKPQIAYYSAVGKEQLLVEIIAYIHSTYPQIPVILDAKRADIGSTAQAYAQEAFERYQADAVTVNPYMGFDAVAPFMAHSGKLVFSLARTSNPSADIQETPLKQGEGGVPLYQHFASRLWQESKAMQSPAGSLGFVVGATVPQALKYLASTYPEAYLLIPGIGAQGGSLEAVKNALSTRAIPRALINVSRGLYSSAGSTESLREQVQLKAASYHEQMLSLGA